MLLVLWAYAQKLRTMHVNAVKKERRQVNKTILRIKKSLEYRGAMISKETRQG